MFGLQGLLYFNARLRMLERRQQQIRELMSKQERLKVELEEAKTRLMLHPSKWSGECEYETRQSSSEATEVVRFQFSV